MGLDGGGRGQGGGMGRLGAGREGESQHAVVDAADTLEEGGGRVEVGEVRWGQAERYRASTLSVK